MYTASDLELIGMVVPALRARLADQRGATMVEYGLVLALVAVVAMVGFTFIGNSTNDKLQCTGGEMGGAVHEGADPGAADDFYDVDGDDTKDDNELLVSQCA